MSIPSQSGEPCSLPHILVNIDGSLRRAEEAFVSALDHGFLYGESVYETLRTYHGRPFLLERHLDRLERSAERIFLPFPVSRDTLTEEVFRTVFAHGESYGNSGDLAIRIVVTRGVGPIGLDASLCSNPGFLLYVFPAPQIPERLRREGISVVVSHVRRNHPKALDPGIKSGNFLNNILAYRDATEADAHEAILLNAEGCVAEGTTSNVFTVKNGHLRTPLAVGILDGITRAVVLEEARRAGIPATEEDIPAEDLLNADEIFITSSVRGIVPATRVNELKVGTGKPGEITARLCEIYGSRIERECG